MNFWQLSVILPVFVTSLFQAGFETIGFQMTKRANSQGVTRKNVANIYYSKDGKMVSYYPSPNELYVINNARGELTIYNPKRNEVFQRVNYMLSSENTNVYYFFQDKKEDMGLERIGFILSDTKMDDGLIVSTWKAPMQLQKEFSAVELVHKGDKPVFLGYKDTKDKFVKKVYFYDYTSIRGLDIPQSITEIDYVKSDSIITKTTFSNFSLNNAKNDEYLHFEVPSSAKLIE